jgi:hypothetical protein
MTSLASAIISSAVNPSCRTAESDSLKSFLAFVSGVVGLGWGLGWGLGVFLGVFLDVFLRVLMVIS